MAGSTCPTVSERDQLSSNNTEYFAPPPIPACSTKPQHVSMATGVTVIENGDSYPPNDTKEDSLDEKSEMEGIPRHQQRKDISDGRGGEVVDVMRHPPPRMEIFSQIDEGDWSVKLEGEGGEERVIGHSLDKRFLKYDLEIGRGSFKTVYKGLDTDTGVAVAWCELMENKFDKTEQARFKDEVKILKTLNNPYILRLYDSWASTRPNDKKRILVLITELMTSGTLKGYMKRLKSIKPRMIRGWGRQILKGLYFLHTRTPPIIHRDLKCDNIFINGTTGVVKIGDLGLATLKKSDVKTVIGTPEFMAPEMYEEQYDESVDVYAFGMCLLEMTTREYPYRECQNPAQIFKKVTNGILPQALVKIEDAALKEVIDGCIRSVKKERFTVKELIDHEFFAEGDVKVEVVDRKELVDPKGEVMFRMEVPNKESKKDRQETVEFAYNLHSDVPECVVEEMIKSGILREEDRKNVIRNVREQVGTQKKRLQGQFIIPSEANRDGEVKGQHVPDTVLVPPTDATPTPMDSEGTRHPPKLQHQNSNTSDSDPSDTMLKPTPPTSIKEHGTEELLATPPISTQSSPALSTRNSDLTSVLEETEDERSTESDGEEKKGIKKCKGLDRKDSHPVDVHSDEDRGKETKGEEGYVKGVGRGDNEMGSEDNNTVLPRLHEATPTGDNPTESGEASIQQQQTQPQTAQPDPTPEHMGGVKKKSVRGKESKKVPRLRLTERYTTGVVLCVLNIGEKMINFKFSTEYDKPREIFQNMLKAKYLCKNDEEEFVKRISEIVESIRKGECTLPIKEPPKGEGHRNGTSDGHTEVATQRERAGSSRASSKDYDITTEGSTAVPKDQVKQTSETRPKGDYPAMPVTTALIKSENKKDVATSMTPVSSLESRSRRKLETADVNKTPVSSQSSLDSTATLSPVQEHTRDGFSVEPSSQTTNSPPLSVTAAESGPATTSSKVSLPPTASSSTVTPPTSITAQPSSTTVITTTGKKTFEIQDVSFNAEEGFEVPSQDSRSRPRIEYEAVSRVGLESASASNMQYPLQDGRSRSRGEYENVSRTGLESVSSNSMQSDSHSTINGMESAPFSQIDGGVSWAAGSTATFSQAGYANPSYHPTYTGPPLHISGLDTIEHIDLHVLNSGVGKFLYYMSQILKDPDIAQLTNSLEQHYGRSAATQPHHTGVPQGPPPTVHHHTPPVAMTTGAQSSTPYPQPQTQQSGGDYCDSTDGDPEYKHNLRALEKEFEDRQRQLEEEKKLRLTYLHSSRRNYGGPPSNANTSSDSGIPGAMTGSTGQSSRVITTIGYQPPLSSSTMTTGGHLRKQTSDLHPYHHPMGITADQREGLYLATHSTPSHSPSRDMSQNPPPPPSQGVGHPPSYPPPNMGPSGQQQMHVLESAGAYYERFQGQVQSQSPIPNQGQVPNTQNYPYVHPIYYHPPVGYQSTNGGYKPTPPMFSGNTSSYPYMQNRAPDLGQDGDHQNSITQKR